MKNQFNINLNIIHNYNKVKFNRKSTIFNKDIQKLEHIY